MLLSSHSLFPYLGEYGVTTPNSGTVHRKKIAYVLPVTPFLLHNIEDTLEVLMKLDLIEIDIL